MVVLQGRCVGRQLHRAAEVSELGIITEEVASNEDLTDPVCEAAPCKVVNVV